MSKKIIVAGAGHGGIVTAYFLAQNGFDITVYEKKKEEDLGLDQSDSVHIEDFEKAGLPYPEEYLVKRTPISFYLPKSDYEPISQMDNDNDLHLFIDRKILIRYLLNLAKQAGVKFKFECNILEPIILGSRVAGIKTDYEDIYADLIIDSCGVNSPLRTQLPDFMNIQKQPDNFDIFSAYRGYYEINPDAEEPKNKYKLALISEDDIQGLAWIIKKDNYADVLIANLNELTCEQLDKQLKILKSDNPVIGDKLIKGGYITEIPVRQPLAVLVADGYAAVGDSAFMTVPIKGSGVGYSIRAGKILSDAIIADENGLYNRETLWKYQIDFFDRIGSGASILAILKSCLPKITREDLEYIFSEKIVTTDDMELFATEKGAIKILSNMKFGFIKEKTKKLVGQSNVRKLLLEIGKSIGIYKLLEKSLHDKYDSSSVEKWAEIYNSFFENLKDE